MRFHFVAACAPAALLAVAVAACGTTTAGGAGAASSPRGSGTPSAVLSFTIAASSRLPAVSGTLKCGPPGGTVPDAATACRTLLRMKHDPFTPPPTSVACPMIMASGGKITLTGSWFGRPVHRVVMDGECDLLLYGVLAKILR